MGKDEDAELDDGDGEEESLVSEVVDGKDEKDVSEGSVNEKYRGGRS